jgi:hypothetical protein
MLEGKISKVGGSVQSQNQDNHNSLLGSAIKRRRSLVKSATKQKLKVIRSLELHADYYSLVYFGFWLDTDEEQLSSYRKLS